MLYEVLPAPLKRLADEVGAALATAKDEATLLRTVDRSMRALVATDDWLDPAFAIPHPQYYQQYLLYAEPRGRFSIVSFVWGPGQQTPVHDHTVWGVIGMLRGAERTQHYEVGPDGVPVPTGEEIELRPGAVCSVSPTIGDVHRVWNAFGDRVSISVHVYGADIGTVQRHVFPDGGGPPRPFVSGYANAGHGG